VIGRFYWLVKPTKHRRRDSTRQLRRVGGMYWALPSCPFVLHISNLFIIQLPLYSFIHDSKNVYSTNTSHHSNFKDFGPYINRFFFVHLSVLATCGNGIWAEDSYRKFLACVMRCQLSLVASYRIGLRSQCATCEMFFMSHDSADGTTVLSVCLSVSVECIQLDQVSWFHLGATPSTGRRRRRGTN